MNETYEFEEDHLIKMGDAILWTTILAAVHQDGVIEPEERAEAIKQTHIRTFSTEAYLKPIYEHVDKRFEKDFDAYSSLLPADYEEKEVFIQAKLNESMAVLPELGPVFSAMFSQSLKTLYNRVFNAGSNVFQIFALPVLSAHLDKKNKK
jgi:hypothetical protein